MAPRIRAAAPALREDGPAVRAAIDRVLASQWLILGPEVEAFEAEFAAASGVPHAIGVGNGTDAIALILRALGIGPGDEVITTPISAAFTALAVLMVGARPVFADVDPVRLTLDPETVDSAVTPRTRAILPVHLYGQAADMDGLARVAARHGLALVEDCCQAHLATASSPESTWRPRPVGSIGIAGAFSFYPTKNLPALGDGGAVVTADAALADRIRRLRHGGQSARDRHELAGVNSRLDEIQAAVLRARLPFLPAWTARRRALAASYRRALAGGPAVPLAERDPGHVYHLFVVRASDGQRDPLARHLADHGIETPVHYPVPITGQPAFAECRPAACPQADRACDEILSLPLHPGLTDDEVDVVAAAVSRYPSAVNRTILT